MSLSNEELARRADLVIADLSGGTKGGLLLPEQSNTLIDMVVEQPTILRQLRVERMNSPQKRIERVGFDQRIMQAARDANPPGAGPYELDTGGGNTRYLLAAERSKVVTSMIQLETKEVMAEIRLPYEVLEDNIERGAFEAHVMRLIAERAAEDFEEWVLRADTALSGSDAYLGLHDGLLKQATSHVVDNTGNSGISPDMFESGLLAMPQKYLRNTSAMKHIITVQDEIRYRANVAKRTTGYGDSSLTSDNQLMAFGTIVEKAPLMPADTGLFTFPKNAIFGIQRDIQVETDKDIRSREIIIVLTARIDCLWDDEDAVVKYIGVNA